MLDSFMLAFALGSPAPEPKPPVYVPTLEAPKLSEDTPPISWARKCAVKASEASPGCDCRYCGGPGRSATPEAKPEAKPEDKADAKPEVKPEGKPEAKPEAKAEAKAEAKPSYRLADNTGKVWEWHDINWLNQWVASVNAIGEGATVAKNQAGALWNQAVASPAMNTQPLVQPQLQAAPAYWQVLPQASPVYWQVMPQSTQFCVGGSCFR
jgi:hypothetical protein